MRSGSSRIDVGFVDRRSTFATPAPRMSSPRSRRSNSWTCRSRVSTLRRRGVSRDCFFIERSLLLAHLPAADRTHSFSAAREDQSERSFGVIHPENEPATLFVARLDDATREEPRMVQHRLDVLDLHAMLQVLLRLPESH